MSRLKFFISLCTLALFFPWLSATGSAIVTPHYYAWSDTVGYINFFAVTVNDTNLSGFAWAPQSGWIKFNSARGGVFNDGTGKLSGSAWGEQLGWIDFSNVRINQNGKFIGIATGPLAGTVTFDCRHCDVETDWRPTSAPVAIPILSVTGEGGGSLPAPALSPPTSEEALPPPVTTPLTPFTDPLLVDRAQKSDIQKDGIINILDFNAMMVNWGSTANGNGVDMNKDGVVDIFDFNQLMVLWGISYQL